MIEDGLDSTRGWVAPTELGKHRKTLIILRITLEIQDEEEFDFESHFNGDFSRR